jgi:glucokinase
MSSLVRVLEVGGTHVTAATVDVVAHRVHERTRSALDSAASAASILASLHGAAMSLADTAPARWAVAMPDPFDYARGVGLFRDVGKFDALYGVDVGRALIEAITPRPRSITFAHDTEAFLLGEWVSGAARGARRCAALTLGTGVGSAFLDGDTTVRAGAGLPPGGRVHRLSIDGAPLENSVSRRAIRARYAAQAGRSDDLDVHEIAELARHGDRHAAIVLDDAFCNLGRAFAPAMREFRPDVLVIGGSIAASWDLLIGPLTSGLDNGGVHGMDIRAAEHEADSAVIGAARLAVVRSTTRTAVQPAARAAATREVIARQLARTDVVDRLARYYAHDSDGCGVNFLDGTEAHPSAVVTASDLFAVTTLGLSVPAPVARTLLRDTPAFAEIARCLAPDRLPVDVPLDEATPEIVAAMCELHDAVLAATSDDPALASALCAPLRLPAGSVQSCWRVLGSVLGDAPLRTELEWVFDAVRRRGLLTDVYPLRQICVLAEVPAVCY